MLLMAQRCSGDYVGLSAALSRVDWGVEFVATSFS